MWRAEGFVMALEWRPRFNNISFKMRTPSDRLRFPHPRWQKGTSKFPQRGFWRGGGEVRAADSSGTPRLLREWNSCGWERRLHGPSWLRNHAVGKCLDMWVLTNEQTWETLAWASLPSRQAAGSVPAWACCPNPGWHGDSLQERQVMAAIKAQTGKHLVSLVHWGNSLVWL